MLLADPAAIEVPASGAPAAWAPSYPTSDFLSAAAGYLALMSSQPSTAGFLPEGPTWYTQVTPGGIRVGSVDLSRANRTLEREVARQAFNIAHADELALFRDRPSTREVTRWSPKSRARMAWRFASLDYSPWKERPPAMVTFTLPRNWWEYAPSGKAWKKLVSKFWKRYERAWGRLPAMLWKQEMQRRGAPHLHVLMQTPLGKADDRSWGQWFAETWADVLGCEGEDRERVIYVHGRPEAYGDTREGLRASDPRRVAVYFLKHGSFKAKEYQHNVPELWRAPGAGPGRFWGWRGFKVQTKTVYLTGDEAALLARTVRKHFRSKLSGKARRTLRRRMSGTRGYLIVNDGAWLALCLGEVITLASRRARGPVGDTRGGGEGDASSGFRRWSARLRDAGLVDPHHCGSDCEVMARNALTTGGRSAW